MVANPLDASLNVPFATPLTNLVGREPEIEQVRTLLRREDVRLLTITGPGGVGKTRLALAVAVTVVGDYPGGVRSLSLGPITDSRLVGPELAKALGIRDLQELSLAERFSSIAGDAPLLLVVDNFEHVIVSGPLLTELLGSCTCLTILVTSRERLHLSGEHVFSLAPLDCPHPDHLPTLAQIAGAPAVQLFLERSQAVDPSFALTDANASAVVAICHRLDGLPLAVELAAARIPHLLPAALLARLAHRLPLLTTGPRDAPARLRTLRDAIEWSRELLSEDEQRLFHCLSVFSGGFTLEAAEAVMLAKPGFRRSGEHEFTNDFSRSPGQPSVVDGISSLVDKNLVHRIDHSMDSEPGSGASPELRFGMLDTIRELGHEHLATSGEDHDIRSAHAAFYLALVDDVVTRGPAHITGFNRLEMEYANLRTALAWTCESGTPQLALHYAAHLAGFWQHRGFQREGRHWLERALSIEMTGDSALQSTAWSALGGLLRDLGEVSEARQSFQRALEMACAAGDRWAEATALVGLSALADDVGDDATTKILCEASVKIFRELEDPSGLARALHNLGWAEAGLGNVATALASFRQSLDHARVADSPRAIAHALNSLGNLCAERGHVVEASSLLEESLSIARAALDRTEMAETLFDLGWLKLELDDVSSARLYFREGLDLLQGIERGRIAVNAIEGCAVIAATTGRHDLALRLVTATSSMRNMLAIRSENDARSDGAGCASARAVLKRLRGKSTGVSVMSPEEALREAKTIVGAVINEQGLSSCLESLSARERDVLDLLAQGRTDRQIADSLFISRRTASKHVSSILGKLGATNRTEAATSLYREPQT